MGWSEHGIMQRGAKSCNIEKTVSYHSVDWWVNLADVCGPSHATSSGRGQFPFQNSSNETETLESSTYRLTGRLLRCERIWSSLASARAAHTWRTPHPGKKTHSAWCIKVYDRGTVPLFWLKCCQKNRAMWYPLILSPKSSDFDSWVAMLFTIWLSCAY